MNCLIYIIAGLIGLVLIAIIVVAVLRVTDEGYCTSASPGPRLIPPVSRSEWAAQCPPCLDCQKILPTTCPQHPDATKQEIGFPLENTCDYNKIYCGQIWNNPRPYYGLSPGFNPRAPQPI